jgi:hypothetical protein
MTDMATGCDVTGYRHHKWRHKTEVGVLVRFSGVFW